MRRIIMLVAVSFAAGPLAASWGGFREADTTASASGPAVVSAQAPSPALLVLLRTERALAIVDPTTRKVVGRAPTGDDPHGVAASPDGKLAFTANYGGNSISVIDLATRKEIRRVELPAGRPHDMVFAGGKVYFTAEGYKAIGRLDPATLAVDWWMGTGQDSTHMIVANRDATKIFTANRASNTVSVIESSGTGPAWSVTTIPVGRSAEGIDLAPNGREIWTANRDGGGVSIIDAVAKKVIQTLDVKTTNGNRVRVTPDGRYVLVADESGNTLLILDAASRKEIKRLKLLPDVILITPDGSRAYTTISPENHVVEIDLKTLEVSGRIDTGTSPDAMAWIEGRP